ncbi:NUDIX domain-containing protein [Gluconobacter sp. Dm-62]|uniref:NUDIX hydrolase n=1 Tax=Gluconobacter sp. Dm-62 TaxID=2799804 RepID=UPI001B8D5196|nr:NUDIX domain-containing protein [Gluconobacter sp. Dm-62]MBS1102580.1 NUDIX domain-containing protein [Gluconobacter sp. Dm-62]
MTTPRRAPFQALVLPFRKADRGTEYALFRRSDSGDWQPIAGGGDEGETPHQTAKREMQEESGLSADTLLFPLQASATIPVSHFAARSEWSPQLYATRQTLSLSAEHTICGWFSYEDARQHLSWDSNRTALWETAERLRDGKLLP